MATLFLCLAVCSPALVGAVALAGRALLGER